MRLLLTALTVSTAITPALAHAQSLRGSPESVDRMYHRAHASRLTFYSSAEQVKAAATRGAVTTLTGNMNYAVVGTQLPYVRPATLRFIEALGAAHRQACGEPIIVTSGVRPTSRKLRNGHAKSVHPTGMAVDIRKSPGACRDWLRRALLGLEAQGTIEAIEENRPPHFHIAVYSTPQPAAIIAAANRTPAPAVAAHRSRRSRSVASRSRQRARSSAKASRPARVAAKTAGGSNDDANR